jgi:lipopolysaccharide/colanic/teichoic acid biosynthesis glycosyltransferase
MAKRVLDLAIAIPALIVSLPVILIAGLLIKIDSPGPAVYRGVRVGKDGRLFRIYKLRTMKLGADLAGPPVTVADDPRVTRIGRRLRSTKLDELPQLLNVVKGDMSLVGPRPEHPDYVRLYTANQGRLLALRPGITSSASIAFADEARLLKGDHPSDFYTQRVLPSKLAKELEYLGSKSVRHDLGIMLGTLALVFRALRTRLRSGPGR